MSHYTNGRRWSYIHKMWVLESSWNDKEEIAALQFKIEQLESRIQMCTLRPGYEPVPSAIAQEIHRRADKEACLDEQCDFSVTVSYEDYKKWEDEMFSRIEAQEENHG